jgi:hypothetical protein
LHCSLYQSISHIHTFTHSHTHLGRLSIFLLLFFHTYFLQADFFDCAGYYATHDKVGNKFLGNDQNYIRKENKGPDIGDVHEGIEMFRRARQGKTMLDYNKIRVKEPIDAHCQMDTNRVSLFDYYFIVSSFQQHQTIQ